MYLQMFFAKHHPFSPGLNMSSPCDGGWIERAAIFKLSINYPLGDVFVISTVLFQTHFMNSYLEHSL